MVFSSILVVFIINGIIFIDRPRLVRYQIFIIIVAIILLFINNYFITKNITLITAYVEHKRYFIGNHTHYFEMFMLHSVTQPRSILDV